MAKDFDFRKGGKSFFTKKHEKPMATAFRA
jgi:hypothetical protein